MGRYRRSGSTLLFQLHAVDGMAIGGLGQTKQRSARLTPIRASRSRCARIHPDLGKIPWFSDRSLHSNNPPRFGASGPRIEQSMDPRLLSLRMLSDRLGDAQRRPQKRRWPFSMEPHRIACAGEILNSALGPLSLMHQLVLHTSSIITSP